MSYWILSIETGPRWHATTLSLCINSCNPYNTTPQWVKPILSLMLFSFQLQCFVHVHTCICILNWSLSIKVWFHEKKTCDFLAATKQLYDWFSPSVCLSVCPSVRLSVTPFSPCSHHHIIMKFSGVITNDKSDVHAKGRGQRSKVKVTEVNTQLNRFRTVTLVWIHIWWWNDAYSLMMLRRGALLFFKVIRQISRSHGSKKCQIWPRLGVSGL